VAAALPTALQRVREKLASLQEHQDPP
jgi:hypothetical protein